VKVHGWAADGAGCWWYRLEMPLRELERRAVVEVAAIDERLDVYVRNGHTEPRIIIGQRVSKEGPSGIWQQMARDGRHTLVYEVDDDLLDIDAQSNPIGFEFFSQPEVRKNIIRNVHAADHVVVSTEALAQVDWIRDWAKNVVVLPNGVPSELLEWDHALPEVARAEHGLPVVIGWQGSATHGADWADAAGYVDRAIRQAHPNALLRVFGGRAEWFASMRCRREHIRWVPDIWAYYRGLRMDIALAPLRPSVFNRSKSPIRAMEAGALGIPVIASAAGPYESYVKSGHTGQLVERDHQWAQYIRRLINEPHTRARMGAAGREQARDHTIEGPVGDTWEKFYRTLGEKQCVTF
jgi:glycosyltransferase involved in cell wall biosynthesis